VSFACDICKATEEIEHDIEADLSKDVPLPQTWSTLVAYTNGPETLHVELCPVCMKAIKDAIYEETE
jgi:hypothetical protein